jgi:hypothetical protein
MTPERTYMEDAIKRKLRRELSNKCPLTEARVVYILVQIRKLIERTGQKQQYIPLDFHCSWALHAEMNRKEAARILQRIDEGYELLKDKSLEHQSLDERQIMLCYELGATAGMDKFRVCLEEFLTTYDLPTKIVQKDWPQFLRHYAAVIEDCPLIIQNPEKNLQHITHVTVKKNYLRSKREGASPRVELFMLQWVAHGKDSNTRTMITCHAIP